MELQRCVRVLATAAALSVTAGTVDAQRATSVGVGTHQLDARSVTELRGLGSRHVRHGLYLHQAEDPKQWADWTVGLERALRAGLDPLIVIHHPDHARLRPEERERVWERVTRAAVRLASEYPVSAIQLWNEPDLPAFTDAFGAFSGLAARERGRLYGAMLRRAYPRIKAARPSTLVVTAGLADNGTGLRDFLVAMGDAPYDVLALHTYGLPALQSAQEKAVIARPLTGRPMWITEFGLDQAVIPPGWDRSRAAVDRHHLDTMRDIVEWNDRTGSYDRLYWHVLRQDGALSYDLIRPDGSLRPAAQWLRARGN